MLCVFALLPLLQTATASADLRESYDVGAYRLQLVVQPDTKTLDGRVGIDGIVTADELDVLTLDLVADLEVLSVTGAGTKPLTYSRSGDLVLIELGREHKRDEPFTATVRYRGQPTAIDNFSGFHWSETEAGLPWINTSCQGPGAHSWWPCKSSFFHPEDKPARVRVEATVPAGLTAVSNGRLDSVVAGGPDWLRLNPDEWNTFHWQHNYPLETYSVTLNVAPYVTQVAQVELPGLEDPLKTYAYVLPEDAEKAKLQFAQVPELLRVYSDAFGPFPFPDSKFGLVQTNFWGMEHSTAVAYGSSFPAWCEENDVEDPYARRNRWFDYILIHEVAHEWWGNAVSADHWGNFWIHEGFGTYAEGVYVEKTSSRADADRFFLEMGKRLRQTATLYRGDHPTSEEAYAGLIYSKGACVLNTLRHYVNDDEVWWRSVRAFNLEYRYSNAGTDEFRAILERESGREWKRFFDEWVYAPGHPVTRGSVQLQGGWIVVDVEVEGDFQVPLDLEISYGADSAEKRIWLEPGRTQDRISAKPNAAGTIPTAVRVVNLDRVLGRHSVE